MCTFAEVCTRPAAGAPGQEKAEGGVGYCSAEPPALGSRSFIPDAIPYTALSGNLAAADWLHFGRRRGGCGEEPSGSGQS